MVELNRYLLNNDICMVFDLLNFKGNINMASTSTVLRTP